MFDDFFNFGPKKYLGIDIGTSSIKIVEISKKGRGFKLENYGELKIGDFGNKKETFAAKNGLSFSSEKIAAVIKSIKKEANIKTREASFSIPDFSSFFINFNIPAMGKEEISQSVKYEVRPYIPLPLSEITLDWLIIGGEIGKTPLKILAVAIPNDVIEQYKIVASLANLKIKSLEPEIFSLARSLVTEEEKNGVVGLIDIGLRSSICSIVEKKVVKTSYSFNIAGNEFTEAIAKSLNIDYNKAEEMRNKHGLISESENSSNQSVKKILLPLVDLMLAEVKKVFRGFYRSEGKEVEKIILTGGIIFLPGLKDYFTSQLNKKIIIANPFKNIIYNPVLKPVLEERGPSYAVATGLALKGFK